MHSDTPSGSLKQEHGDADLLSEWYHFTCRRPGSIGFVLKEQRLKFFQTQEQQRAQLGIADDTHEHAWIHLQGMSLPRWGANFENDVFRIARRIEQKHTTTTINLIGLGNILAERD